LFFLWIDWRSPPPSKDKSTNTCRPSFCSIFPYSFFQKMSRQENQSLEQGGGCARVSEEPCHDD
jgi:hypothetical protein